MSSSVPGGGLVADSGGGAAAGAVGMDTGASEGIAASGDDADGDATADSGGAPSDGSPPKSLQPMAVGALIRTLFKVRGQDRWYEGEVTAVHPDGTYDARYSDGDVYEHLQCKKLVPSTPGEADRLNSASARSAGDMSSPRSSTASGSAELDVMDDSPTSPASPASPAAEDYFADGLRGAAGRGDGSVEGDGGGNCNVM